MLQVAMFYDYKTTIFEGFKQLEELQLKEQIFYINIYAVNCPDVWARKYELKVEVESSTINYTLSGFLNPMEENDSKTVEILRKSKFISSIKQASALVKDYLFRKHAQTNFSTEIKKETHTHSITTEHDDGARSDPTLFDDENFVEVTGIFEGGNAILQIGTSKTVEYNEKVEASAFNQKGTVSVSDLQSQISAKAMIDWLSAKVEQDRCLVKSRFLLINEANAEGYEQKNIRAAILDKYDEHMSSNRHSFGFYILGIIERGFTREDHTVLVVTHSSGIKVFNNRRGKQDSGGFDTVYCGLQSIRDRNNCSRYSAFLAFELIKLVSQNPATVMDDIKKVALKLSCSTTELKAFCTENHEQLTYFPVYSDKKK
ncbi:hypothetical protein JQC92_09795 [Shewanella sp. 202IG2-18]|uniref:hypothetical protein n=1 Tax=Parashewanella hymeniacidonis TaxID=2807618 RepID=UPI00196158DA|nr:hypothetical protein [Parashewanella hymeniacidonis]MBM7072320.1 hypothetical protein [Parashewanella hymeniacidonis]